MQNEAGTLFPVKVENSGRGEYKAILLDASGEPARGEDGQEISTTFNWALTTRVAEMQQLDRARETMREGKADPDSIARLAALGRKLHSFIFKEKVGAEFERLRSTGERVYIQLFLHPDLDDVPWEYICEPDAPGEPRFLLLDPKISLSRGNNPAHRKVTLAELPRPLKMLVIVSSPPDLPEHQKLDTLRELRLLRQAVAPLVARGELELHELDEPSPAFIADEMNWQPHIVHYTGHGNYDSSRGGIVVVEDGDNHTLQVTAADFAAMMVTGDRDDWARLVVLSACRSGEATAEGSLKGLPGVGAKLVAAGVPAVVAMQESVRDDHASIWAGRFYSSLVKGWSVAQAMAEARLHLKLKPACDWGMPVLLAEDPTLALFRFIEGSRPAPPPERGEDSVLLNNPGGLFVGRQLEQRELVKGLLGDSMRIGIITGPGGIGKSSLSYRLYERTRGHFWAALSIDCSVKPSGEQILVTIDEWLRRNGDERLNAVLQNEKLTIEQKLPNIVGALERSEGPYLLVMDNFESVLEEQNDGSFTPQDELTGKLLSALGKGLRRSKLLITTRYHFQFDYLAGNVEWVSLDDLSVSEVVSLMGQQPQLGKKGTRKDYVEMWEAEVRNPRLIELIEAVLKREPLSYVKAHIKNVQGKLQENQLLDLLYSKLNEDARAMLRRGSVYRLAVPLHFLEMQVVEYPVERQGARLQTLLDRSLLNNVERETNRRLETRYRLHASTRQWAEDKLGTEEGENGIRDAQKRAAKAHADWIANSHALEDGLEARRLYYAAQEYSAAGKTMLPIFEALHRRGYYSLARSLLHETVESLGGITLERSANLHHLGILEQAQGNYAEARRLYNESLRIMQQLGDLRGMSRSLGQLGILEQAQGNYAEARRLYNESLRIMQQLGDLRGMSSSLHELGRLEQKQGNYAEARRLYNEGLKIAEQLGDLSAMSRSLHQLGTLEQRQGNYAEARRLYNESLRIKQQLGDLSGMSNSLGQLGILEQDQGNYAEARRLYNESLRIMQQLGDLSGMSRSLHQLGTLEQRQGNYAEARRLYNESLRIMQQLGDLSAMSSSLNQLGILEQDQGNYAEARRLYNEGLRIMQQLGDLSGMSSSLHELGRLEQKQGNYAEARLLYNEGLKIDQQLGDLSGMATSLGQLGGLTQLEGNLAEAQKLQEQSLSIRHRLGDVNGVAISMGNLGGIAELQEDFEKALGNYFRAYIVFDGLNSPNKDVVGTFIARVREKIGEEQYQAYLKEIFMELAQEQADRGESNE